MIPRQRSPAPQQRSQCALATSARETGRRAIRGRAVPVGALGSLLGLAAALAAHAAPPQRIVSLNSCTDAILVELVRPARIAALSHWSRDPHGSIIAEQAHRLPATYDSAEEVAALKPDLVLTGQFGSAPLERTLQRLGIPVLRTRTPFTVAESEAQIRAVAARVGAPERGAALVSRIEAALTAAAPPARARPVPTLLLNPGGSTLGPGTLTGELMRRAGLENIAGRYSAGDWGQLRLEQVVADPPRLLLTEPRGARAVGWSERITTHPALRAVRARMTRAPLPERFLFCGGPSIVPAMQALAAARRRVGP